MAAPSGIVWGSIVNSNYRLGIYVSKNSSATQTAVTIETWLWSKWSLSDGVNYYYFDNEATSATTKVAEHISIEHTVASGSGWSTSNQTKLATHTYAYNHTTSVQTISCAAKISSIGSGSAVVSSSTTYTIPALASYTVSYNANGGTGAPTSQTKWHSITLTLSSVKPSRTGYDFLGWARSSTATTIDYAAGAFFGYNENTILYAVWKAHTYTVSFNANGGTGAPTSQTKTHGVALTITSSKPTRTNYNFLGWGTSASSTTVAYTSGSSYTANSAITLYAVWELAYAAPRITGVRVVRSESEGAESDTGTYISANFSWATDYSVSSIKIVWGPAGGTNTTITVSASGTSGTVSQIFGDGGVSIEKAYTVRIAVTDSGGTTTSTSTVPGATYLIDFLSGGGGVAIGKPAEKDGLEVEFDAKFNGDIIAEGYKGDDIYVMNEHECRMSNTTSTTTDDTVDTWLGHHNSVHWYSEKERLVDQPERWGFLLSHSYNWWGSKEVRQLFLSSGSLYLRGGNANGWVTTWRELLNSANVGNYALPIAGGTTTGYVKLGNTVNAIGQVRQHTDYLGFFPSVSDAQNNTNRRGWVGYNSTNNFSVVNNSSGSNITNVAWTVSSDKRLKTDVEDIPDTLIDIWNELQPKIFRWNELNSTNTKYHFGLIAQDVISAFEKRGLDWQEYGFVNSFTLSDDDTEYFGIAYDEYHILTSAAMRRANERIDRLQTQIDELRTMIEGLKE